MSALETRATTGAATLVAAIGTIAAVALTLGAHAAVAADGTKASGPLARDVRTLVPDVRPLENDIRAIDALSGQIRAEPRALVADIAPLAAAIRDLDAEVRAHEIRVDLSADVLFDFDRHDLKAQARRELEKVLLIIREKGHGDVRIEGHTDAEGSEDYNQRLSERRAQSVLQWLTEAGLERGRLSATGWGESRPAAPNTQPNGRDSPAGRAENRRVEVVIQTTRVAGR